MYFNSYVFILIFLPLVVFGYYLFLDKLGKTASHRWLLLASLLFCGYLNWRFAFIVLVCSVIGYCFIYAVSKSEAGFRYKKNMLILGVVSHISILFVFKYYNFFVDTVNQITKKEFRGLELLMPLGISFYTFQQIAYLIDCYKDSSKRMAFEKYLLFVLYFPKFLQGPIILYEDFYTRLCQVDKDKKYDSIGQGLYWFASGLAKKVLIADILARMVDAGYGNIEELNATSAIFVMIAYSLQLYFDFSGYSDMACGIGKMLQIDLPVNFDSPYKATSVTDIWSRWHITLTRFFTRYVYIPLGGNRKGVRRMYVNTLIIFLLSGLWHGAAWTFVIWGMLHGVVYCISKWRKQAKIFVPNVVGWFLTFSFWVGSFAIFRAQNLEEAKKIFTRVVSGKWDRLEKLLFDSVEGVMEIRVLQRVDVWDLIDSYHEIVPIAILLFGMVICLCADNTQQRVKRMKYSAGNMIWVVFLLVYCVMSLSGVNVFLYANF